MDIYTLSKPAPNWEAMDPYSGLSKYHESAEDTDPVPSTHSNANNKSAQVKSSKPDIINCIEAKETINVSDIWRNV